MLFVRKVSIIVCIDKTHNLVDLVQDRAAEAMVEDTAVAVANEAVLVEATHDQTFVANLKRTT
jgi:hypothetical protein